MTSRSTKFLSEAFRLFPEIEVVTVSIDARVKNGVLVPADADSQKLLDALGEGVVRAQLSKRRSSPHLRKYWATLHRVIESGTAGDHYPTAEHLHRALLVELGFTTPVYVPRAGGQIFVPDSVAFDKMNEATFAEYTRRVFDFVYVQFGLDVDSLEGS